MTDKAATVELPFTPEDLEKYGTTMSEFQTRSTFRTAAHYGGSFMKKLSAAALCADARNRSRILGAFPELVATYGPGSNLYSEKL